MVASSNPMREVVFVEGMRIPFQRSGTGYRDLTAYDLARIALKALLDRTELPGEQVDFVILGNVIQNVNTSNVARDAALAAGIPHSVPAYTVTLACISANRAITAGADLIATGQADVVIAGGTESLSDIPIRFRKRFRQRLVASRKARNWKDYWKLVKGLSWRDLLPEIPSISEFSTQRTMGEDCDRLAARIGVTRREQDEYALRSHQLAAKAIEEGLLNREVAPALVPPEFQPVERDNGPRPDSTLEKLQSLRPVFVKPHGTLTAGNSSFLTDGAAVTLLMSRQAAERLGYRPRAALRAYAYSAQDPFEELLLGPAYSIPRVLDRAGIKLNDIDVFELHEAFAAQVVANLKCLASRQFARDKLGRSEPVGEVPLDKLNCWGGSLAIGHPFGATGARLVTTAVNRLLQEDGQFALVASCAAGAHGNAILLERLN